MNIARLPDLEHWLLDQIRNRLGGSRDGFHLSGLLTPRKEFWQKVQPLLATDAEVGYFIAGRGHEDAVGRMAGLVFTKQEEVGGISFRPDFTFLEVPLEFKTRRRNLAKAGEEAVVYENYLDQLRGYCALKQSTTGYLFVLSLLEGQKFGSAGPTKPEFACYRVQFDEAELETERRLLGQRRQQLESLFISWSFEQLAAGLGGRPPIPPDHTELPLCKDWMCGKWLKVETGKPRCDTCPRDFLSDLGAKSHKRANSKHTVIFPEPVWKYEARCKWYGPCRPQDMDSNRGVKK